MLESASSIGNYLLKKHQINSNYPSALSSVVSNQTVNINSNSPSALSSAVSNQTVNINSNSPSSMRRYETIKNNSNFSPLMRNYETVTNNQDLKLNQGNSTSKVSQMVQMYESIISNIGIIKAKDSQIINQRVEEKSNSKHSLVNKKYLDVLKTTKDITIDTTKDITIDTIGEQDMIVNPNTSSVLLKIKNPVRSNKTVVVNPIYKNMRNSIEFLSHIYTFISGVNINIKSLLSQKHYEYLLTSKKETLICPLTIENSIHYNSDALIPYKEGNLENLNNSKLEALLTENKESEKVLLKENQYYKESEKVLLKENQYYKESEKVLLKENQYYKESEKVLLKENQYYKESEKVLLKENQYYKENEKVLLKENQYYKESEKVLLKENQYYKESEKVLLKENQYYKEKADALLKDEKEKVKILSKDLQDKNEKINVLLYDKKNFDSLFKKCLEKDLLITKLTNKNNNVEKDLTGSNNLKKTQESESKNSIHLSGVSINTSKTLIKNDKLFGKEENDKKIELVVYNRIKSELEAKEQVRLYSTTDLYKALVELDNVKRSRNRSIRKYLLFEEKIIQFPTDKQSNNLYHIGSINSKNIIKVDLNKQNLIAPEKLLVDKCNSLGVVLKVINNEVPEESSNESESSEVNHSIVHEESFEVEGSDEEIKEIKEIEEIEEIEEMLEMEELEELCEEGEEVGEKVEYISKNNEGYEESNNHLSVGDVKDDIKQPDNEEYVECGNCEDYLDDDNKDNLNPYKKYKKPHLIRNPLIGNKLIKLVKQKQSMINRFCLLNNSNKLKGQNNLELLPKSYNGHSLSPDLKISPELEISLELSKLLDLEILKVPINKLPNFMLIFNYLLSIMLNAYDIMNSPSLENIIELIFLELNIWITDYFIKKNKNKKIK